MVNKQQHQSLVSMVTMTNTDKLQQKSSNSPTSVTDRNEYGEGCQFTVIGCHISTLPENTARSGDSWEIAKPLGTAVTNTEPSRVQWAPGFILWEENLVTLLTQLIQNKTRERVLSMSSDSGDTVIERQRLLNWRLENAIPHVLRHFFFLARGIVN